MSNKRKAVKLLDEALRAVSEEAANACIFYIETTGVLVEEDFAVAMKEYIYNSLNTTVE